MAHGSTDRVRGRARLLTALLTALTTAATLGLSASRAVAASEVVDLRIGAHEDFTRVVFELDRPTGYRIERASSKSGGQELVVSLDATSIPRKVHSSPKSLIGLVRITPEGDGSVARIQLTQDGLSLKEMILANPPRIVLDVLSPTRVAASKPAETRPSSPPKKEASAPAPKPPAPKAAAAPKPAEPVQTARAETSTASSQPPRAVAKPAPEAAPKPAQDATSTTAPAETLAAAQPAGGATPPVDRRAGTPPPASVGAEPSEGGMATIGMETTGADAGRATPPPAERLAKRTAVPAAPAVAPEPEGGMGMGTIGLAIVGLVVLGGGFVLMRRRRAGGLDEDDEGVEVGGADDDNPFAGLGKATATQSGSAAPAGPGGEFDLAGIEEEEKEAAPVDGPLIGGTGPAAAATDSLIQTMAQDSGSVGAGLAGGDQVGDEEVMRMMREFERRIASLESRLDEVVDARERLERQVAAQTEELRVQRAAIARTQRAVRNMNRPDDEGPTEPAIREP